jgi:hypothetical protein
VKPGKKLLLAMQADKTGVDVYQIELLGRVRVYETLFPSLQPSDDIHEKWDTAFPDLWSSPYNSWDRPVRQSFIIPFITKCSGQTEPPPTKARSRRGRRKTPPLNPEQIEALNQNFDALLTPSFGKKDVANAMGVDDATLCRLLHGGSSIQARRNLAAVLAEEHSAHFTFDNLLDPAFNLNKFRLLPESPDQA